MKGKNNYENHECVFNNFVVSVGSISVRVFAVFVSPQAGHQKCKCSSRDVYLYVWVCLRVFEECRPSSPLFLVVFFRWFRPLSSDFGCFVNVRRRRCDRWMNDNWRRREREKQGISPLPPIWGFSVFVSFCRFLFFLIFVIVGFFLYSRGSEIECVCVCVLGPLCRGRRFAMWFELLSRGEYFYGCSWDERVDNNILHCCGSVLRGGCWKGYWTFFARFVYLLTLYSPIWLSVVMAGAAKRCCCSDEWQFLDWQTTPK